jgi:hypothetical protein
MQSLNTLFSIMLVFALVSSIFSHYVVGIIDERDFEIWH